MKMQVCISVYIPIQNHIIWETQLNSVNFDVAVYVAWNI